MRKTSLFLISLVLLLVSCSDNKISLLGSIDSKYDGETVYLYAFRGDNYEKRELVATTKVENGVFAFNSLEDKDLVKASTLPIIAYVSLFDVDMKKEDLTEKNEQAPMATAILEEGVINVEFVENSMIVSGTPRNDDFYLMYKSMMNLFDFALQNPSEEAIMSVATDAEGRDGAAQLRDLDQKFKDESYLFIKENIKNRVGEFLFLNSGVKTFTPLQMLDLIESAEKDFQERPEVTKLYELFSQLQIESLDMSDDEVDELLNNYRY